MSARFSTVPRTALILIGIAVLVLAVLLLTDRGDLTSATLVLVAFACFITSLFLFSFRREQRIGQQPAALMAIPYTNTLSRILADLGVHAMELLTPTHSNIVGLEGYGLSVVGERSIPGEAE